MQNYDKQQTVANLYFSHTDLILQLKHKKFTTIFFKYVCGF